jgi:hypothetical protein
MVESVVISSKRQCTSVLVLLRRDEVSEDNSGFWFKTLQQLESGILFNDVRSMSGGFDKTLLGSFKASFPYAGKGMPGFLGHPVRRGPPG